MYSSTRYVVHGADLIRRIRASRTMRNRPRQHEPQYTPATQKVRVAWLCTGRIPFSGGLATHLTAWMRELRREEFEAYFFGWGDLDEVQHYLHSCGPVTFIRLPELAYYPWSYPIAVIHVAWHLKRYRVQAIHSALPTNDMLALAAGILARVPVLVCSIEGALMPAWISPSKRLVYFLGYRLTLPHVDHLIALSHAAAADAAQFLCISRDRIGVIYPGVARLPANDIVRESEYLCVGTMCVR